MFTSAIRVLLQGVVEAACILVSQGVPETVDNSLSSGISLPARMEKFTITIFPALAAGPIPADALVRGPVIVMCSSARMTSKHDLCWRQVEILKRWFMSQPLFQGQLMQACVSHCRVCKDSQLAVGGGGG